MSRVRLCLVLGYFESLSLFIRLGAEIVGGLICSGQEFEIVDISSLDSGWLYSVLFGHEEVAYAT